MIERTIEFAQSSGDEGVKATFKDHNVLLLSVATRDLEKGETTVTNIRIHADVHHRELRILAEWLHDVAVEAEGSDDDA